MKKKILVVALGYPTKDNPIEGSFFKEQVDFLSTEYNCSVLVYREYCKGLLFAPKITYDLKEYTKGIKQYYPTAYISISRRLYEIIGSIIQKKLYSQTAVGIYRSKSYRIHREKIINKIIKELSIEYDIVYCITAQGIAFQAFLVSKVQNKPFIISEHRPYPHPGWSTIDVEKEAIEKADCFLAIGNDKIRQIMLQNIHPKRIEYIGNLVDDSKFTYSPIPHVYPTLLIVAAYSYFKNYDMFIDTMSILNSITNFDFRIIIAGYGANKGYAGNIVELEEKVMSSNFASKVELIREVSRNDINSLYNRSDAFVMTSIQEGQPMVALEAGCCGLPIFSTRCGGVDDYVTDEIGRLVDITDSTSLASYLKEFVEGSITFDGRTIRNRIINLYGRKAFMSNFSNVINRLN